MALEQGSVDAWAGLDPFLAASELESGSRAIYRNPAFSSYGFLNTSDDFIKKYPDYLTRVLVVYERARLWILAHPDDIAQLVSDESKQSLDVIKRQLSRSNFTKPVPEEFHISSLRATIPILLDEEIVRKGTDLNKVLAELVDDSFARTAVQTASKAAAAKTN